MGTVFGVFLGLCGVTTALVSLQSAEYMSNAASEVSWRGDYSGDAQILRVHAGYNTGFQLGEPLEA